MFLDFMKQLRVLLYERISSPLLSTFVVSWLVWNYQIVLAIFAGTDLEKKIYILNALLNFESSPWRLLIGPALTTLVFIFLYPYPARGVYWFWHIQQNRLRELRQKIEKQALLSEDDRQRIYAAMYESDTRHQSEMAKRDAEIQRLKDLYETPKNPSQELVTQMANAQEQAERLRLTKRLPEREDKFLWIVGKADSAGRTVSEDDVISEMGIDKTEGRYYAEDLAAKGFVSRNPSETKHGTYNLSLQFGGREYLVRGKPEVDSPNRDSTSVPGHPRSDDDSEDFKWGLEIGRMSDDQKLRARAALNSALLLIANSNVMVSPDDIAYTIGKGWVTRNNAGNLVLTSRGQYFAQNLL
jgi:hypothetical protein